MEVVCVGSNSRCIWRRHDASSWLPKKRLQSQAIKAGAKTMRSFPKNLLVSVHVQRTYYYHVKEIMIRLGKKNQKMNKILIIY